MANKRSFIILLTSLLGFTAVTIQFYFALNRHLADGRTLLYAVNHFFSYFTILTNTAVAVLLFSSVMFKKSKLTLWFSRPVVNSALCLYILIVGIIYYTLLNNKWKPIGAEYFASHVLHGFVPPMYFLIWFKYFRYTALKYSDALKWLIFPACYFVYLLIRGSIVEKYPYFFVDPTKIGYSGVFMYSLGILVFFYLTGALLVFMSHKRTVN